MKSRASRSRSDSLSADAGEMALRRLAGDLRFDRGSISARDVAIETDRTKLVTAISYSGPAGSAARHSTQCRAPVAAGDRPIFPPARDYQARARGQREGARHARRTEHGRQRRLVCGHGARAAGRPFRQRSRRASAGGSTCATSTWRRFSIDAEWKTRVTGQADFTWTFSPAEIDFKFAGPHVEGFGYQAANVRAQGVYQVPRLADGRSGQAVLRFDASGAAYGATATTRATFRFSTPSRPLSYRLEGTFRNLDMRRLPGRLSMPKLETAGRRQLFLRGTGAQLERARQRSPSRWSKARASSRARVLGIESRDRAAQLFGERQRGVAEPAAFRGAARD